MRATTDLESGFTSLAAIDAVRSRVDEVLRSFLDREREEIAAAHPRGGAVLDEVVRLVAAGGKRIRPAFCYWGYRAAGGQDDGGSPEPIVRAAAALELLHTFALIHDDVMDRSEHRRGIQATHAHVAAEHRAHGAGPDAEHLGDSVAILAGDLAAVLADRLFLDAGFRDDRLLEARRHYDRMRVRMAVGQFLDLTEGAAVDEATARRISSLKTGSYTVEGPLLIGAALAGGPPKVADHLSRYGVPLGEAFQIRDDLVDRDSGAPAAAARVTALVAEAEAALQDAPPQLAPGAVEALRSLARAINVPGDPTDEGATRPW